MSQAKEIYNENFDLDKDSRPLNELEKFMKINPTETAILENMRKVGSFTGVRK